MADSIFTKGTFDPSIGSEAISFCRTFPLNEYGREYFPHGLQYNVSWIWGHFYEVETGVTYVFTREFKTANSNFFILCKRNDDPDQDDEHLYGDFGETFMGYTTMDQDNAKGTIEVRPMYPSSTPFEVTLKEQYLHIVDCAGDMDLEFNALAPGYSMYIPGWVGQKNDIMYCEEISKITGTFQGKKVEGWGGVDWCYCPPGNDYRLSKLIGGLEKSWPAWANFYKDETAEGGVFLTGMGDWHLFYHWKFDGKKTETKIYRKYRYKIECNMEKGYIKHIDFELDGIPFEYVTEAVGTRATGIANDNFDSVETVEDDTDWIMGHMNTPDSAKKEVIRQYCTNENFLDRCNNFPEQSNY